MAKTIVQCSKEAELAVISASIKNMNEKINDIHKHIVGNGRPGLLERVSNLEIGAKVTYAIIGLGITGAGIIVSIIIR